MLRSIALVALIGLLMSPLVAWHSGNCCSDTDCCKNGLCPLHKPQTKPAAASDQEEMQCHHTAGAAVPATKCNARAECSRQVQQVHPAPHSRGVLPAAFLMAGPRTERAAMIWPEVAPVSGYVPPPFEPPRPLA